MQLVCSTAPANWASKYLTQWLGNGKDPKHFSKMKLHDQKIMLNTWSYLPTPPLGQDMTQGQFLSGIQQVWIQSFPSPRQVASPRLEEPSLPYYLPIAGGRLFGFMPFPRVLVLCEMQSILSGIWTRVTVPISYDETITPRAPKC